jgi:hypothetical protein
VLVFATNEQCDSKLAQQFPKLASRLADKESTIDPLGEPDKRHCLGRVAPQERMAVPVGLSHLHYRRFSIRISYQNRIAPM